MCNAPAARCRLLQSVLDAQRSDGEVGGEARAVLRDPQRDVARAQHGQLAL